MTFEQAPELADHCCDFSADRDPDSAETKRLLWDDYDIRPLSVTRELWCDEKQRPDWDPSKPITRPLFPELIDTIVYSEKRSVHCICPQTGEQRNLAFQGFEFDRNTLKYCCPGTAYEFGCKGRTECSQAGGVQPGDYGRIVRISLDEFTEDLEKHWCATGSLTAPCSNLEGQARAMGAAGPCRKRQSTNVSKCDLARIFQYLTYTLRYLALEKCCRRYAN